MLSSSAFPAMWKRVAGPLSELVWGLWHPTQPALAGPELNCLLGASTIWRDFFITTQLFGVRESLVGFKVSVFFLPSAIICRCWNVFFFTSVRNYALPSSVCGAYETCTSDRTFCRLP